MFLVFAVFQVLTGLFGSYILLEKVGWLYWMTLSGLVFVLLNVVFEFDSKLLRRYDMLLLVGFAVFIIQGLFSFLIDVYQVHWTCRIAGGEYGIWQIKDTTFLVHDGKRFVCPELFGMGFPGFVPCFILLVLTLEYYERRFPTRFQRTSG